MHDKTRPLTAAAARSGQRQRSSLGSFGVGKELAHSAGVRAGAPDGDATSQPIPAHSSARARRVTIAAFVILVTFFGLMFHGPWARRLGTAGGSTTADPMTEFFTALRQLPGADILSMGHPFARAWPPAPIVDAENVSARCALGIPRRNARPDAEARQVSRPHHEFVFRNWIQGAPR